MVNWGAVRHHLATVVMEWHLTENAREEWGPLAVYFDPSERMIVRVRVWKPDEYADQFFRIKNEMKEQGWFWKSTEEEFGASVQYWQSENNLVGAPRITFYAAREATLMQANALAAAKATGYG